MLKAGQKIFFFLMEWESGCGSVRQEVLTTSVSDQCPILLDSSAITWGPVPVRFENVWLEHHQFKQIFKNRWSEANCSRLQVPENIRICEKQIEILEQGIRKSLVT